MFLESKYHSRSGDSSLCFVLHQFKENLSNRHFIYLHRKHWFVDTLFQVWNPETWRTFKIQFFPGFILVIFFLNSSIGRENGFWKHWKRCTTNRAYIKQFYFQKFLLPPALLLPSEHCSATFSLFSQGRFSFRVGIRKMLIHWFMFSSSLSQKYFTISVSGKSEVVRKAEKLIPLALTHKQWVCCCSV